MKKALFPAVFCLFIMLAGCAVYTPAPRGAVVVHEGGAWVPAHYAANGAWVGGHWN